MGNIVVKSGAEGKTVESRKPTDIETEGDASIQEDDSWARLRSKVQDTAADSRELLKDACQLVNQARVLKTQARQHENTARELRGVPPLSLDALPGPLTVPQVCRLFVVGERTLRAALREPEIAPRILEKNQRVGLWCKYITLIPPDLIAELSARFPVRASIDSQNREEKDDAK